MNHKLISFRIATLGIIVAIALACMFYIDQARAEAIQITKHIFSTQEVGEVAYVPMGDSDSLALIDIQTHTTIDTLDMAQYGCYYPQRARLNLDGTELYLMCEYSQNIVILDTADLSYIAIINRPGVCQQDVTFVQSGAYALASTSDCNGVYQIDVINTATYSITQSIDTYPVSIVSITAHPYQPLAYAAAYQCCYSGSVLVIDTNNFTIQTSIPNGGYMWGVQPSPDGQWVYASDYYYQTGVIKINSQTNGIVGNVAGLGELFGIQITPDGTKLFVAGGWQGTVFVLDAINFSYITSIGVGGGNASEMALTCDGSELYVSNSSNSVPVIDTQTYNVTYNISIPGMSSAYGIAICPQYMAEGAFLSPPSQTQYAEAGETLTYTLQMLNLTGETDSFNLELLPGNNFTTTLSTAQVGPIEDGGSIAFTTWVEIPPDAQPADADTATIQATSVTSPSVTATATLNTLVLGEETAYVTLEDSNKIAMVDVATQMVFDTIDTSQYGCISPWRATMSPDRAYVYFGCYSSGSVLVLETATHTMVTNIPDIPSADDVAFTHSGDYALVGSRWSGQIVVIDTSTYNIVQYIYTNGYPRSIAMHPYLEKAYATSGSGEILVIDTSTFMIVNNIYVGGNPWDVAVSPDGLWVFAGDRNGSGLWVINANTNTLYTTVTGMGELTGLEVSSDGTYIYAGGLYYEVWVIDGHSFTPITNIPVNDSAWELALTSDGSQLYVGNTTNEVVVIDALNFTVSGSITMPGNNTRGIAISPEYPMGGAGTLEGHVYDLGPNPIPQSHVYTSPGPYQQWTDDDGYYHMIMLNGLYTVTAEAYGYFPFSVQDEIITDTTVIQDFHLMEAPIATISGTVTDSLTGWPLYAYIAIAGYPPGGVWTDPVTGIFSVGLPEGSSYAFTVNSWSPGYLSSDRLIDPFYGNLTEDFALEADLESCTAPGYNFFPYDENFEPNNGDFNTYGNGSGADSWEWGSPSTAYPGPPTSGHSGSNVWATNLHGDYNSNEDSYIESPDIDLTPVGDQPTNFSWWQWLQTDWWDSVDIQFSHDGGQNWNTVYGPTSGNVDLQWAQHSVLIDSTYAVFNFRVRFHIYSDYYSTGPGWYVDDLTIGDCQPGEGGLVVGNVYDTSEGIPLTGAEVSNESSEFTHTAVTADPALGDSFYTLFSPAGTHNFTASYPGYNTLTEPVEVASGGTVLHDFFLPSGNLVADPPTLQADMLLGDTQVLTLILNNIGDGSASFELKEENKAFIPNLAWPPLPGSNSTNARSDDQAAFPSQQSSPLQTQGAKMLLIQDYDSWGVPSITTILNNAAIAYDLINSGQIADWDFPRYIMIIIPSVQGSDYYNNFNANLSKFEEYIDSGGLLMMSFCNSGETMMIPYGGTNTWDPQNYDTIVAPDHPIFAGVPNPIYGSNASQNHLEGLLPDDQILMTTTQSPGGSPLMIEREHGSGMLVAGGLAYEFGWLYGQNAGQILNNMIQYYYFVWTFAHDATWLREEPISGTVSAGGYQSIQVTFDASMLHEPGDYLAELKVMNDTHYGPFTIPVTMTVQPPADWGAVAGEVSDAWTGDPLTATIELVGVYTMDADPDYEIWALGGTYSLTAYTAGYYTITLPVEITAGEVIAQDIALEPALPRLGELPEQISMTLPEGSTGTQVLEIANTGPIPLNFTYFEVNPLKSLGSTDSLTGKHILYDEAHCQANIYWYSTLRNDLINAGATIDENYDPFDESTLEGYDILWLNEGGCNWTYGELQILDAWLAGGGTVLIQGENTPATYPPASIFGITYVSDGYCTSGTTTNINPHPITEGVDRFYIEWTCGAITGSPVEAVLDQVMRAHVIAAEQGHGKMVVVADIDFYDSVIGNDDNQLLAMNAFRWLAIPVYGDIPWLSETPEQGSVPGHSSLATTFTFDASALTQGEYDGFLSIEHNDPNHDSPVIIPVQLTVTGVVSPESVYITGPEAGLVGESQGFTAWVEPISTTLPLTYVWEADGQVPITHTNGLSDVVSFIWEAPGTQLITVTASNSFDSVSATYQITITMPSYTTYLPLAQKAKPGGLSMSQPNDITGVNDTFPLSPVWLHHRK
jgi:YVTN family beta-propeller protein